MNYIPPQPPPGRFVYRTPEQEMEHLAQQHRDAEASWRGISEFDIRRKLRGLDRHPFRPMLGRMLATALRRHAPPMLDHLPPEFLEITP